MYKILQRRLATFLPSPLPSALVALQSDTHDSDDFLPARWLHTFLTLVKAPSTAPIPLVLHKNFLVFSKYRGPPQCGQQWLKHFLMHRQRADFLKKLMRTACMTWEVAVQIWITSNKPTAMDKATPVDRRGLFPWVTGHGSLCSSPRRSVRFMSILWTGCRNL